MPISPAISDVVTVLVFGRFIAYQTLRSSRRIDKINHPTEPGRVAPDRADTSRLCTLSAEPAPRSL